MWEADPQKRYEAWYETPAGMFALERQMALLGRLIAGWPRRGHTLLEVQCGSGRFLEAFWEAGLDVTGCESDQGLLEEARKRLGQRADFSVSNPALLPYEDQRFDYAACVAGLEFLSEPEAMLQELFRVTVRGALIAFPNRCSLAGVYASRGGRAKKIKDAGPDKPYWHTPWSVWRILRRVAAARHTTWGSALIGPVWSWKPHCWACRINAGIRPPLGAFVALRVDLAPARACTPLWLRANKLAPNSTGLMFKNPNNP